MRRSTVNHGYHDTNSRRITFQSSVHDVEEQSFANVS